MSYTTQHGAVLIIFHLYHQTTTTAQIVCIGGEGAGAKNTASILLLAHIACGQGDGLDSKRRGD